MYELVYHPSALKKLKRLHPIDQKRIIAKLEILAQEPQSSSLDVKKLANTISSFRLRSGDVRVIFEINKTNKVIYIWNINYRGSIY